MSSLRQAMVRARLGWLGPAIVLVGAAVAAVGIWYVVHAKPSAGPVIDEVSVGDHEYLVVRTEAGGDRAFMEHQNGPDREVVWQAMVPPYAGSADRRAFSWSSIAVTIRVVRDHHAEIFALSFKDGSKIGGMRLAPQHGDIDPTDRGPITVSDGFRSYEIVAGKDWHQLVAIDLATGHALWAQELGPSPVTSAGVKGGVVWVVLPDGKHYFRVFNGAADQSPADSFRPVFLR